MLGTIKDTVDELREEGVKIGVVGITSFRPFPLDAVREALAGAKRVVVLEKALAVGIGGIVSTDVHAALAGIQHAGGVRPHAYTVIAGLGGRPITKASLRGLLQRRRRRRALEPLTFLDLDHELGGPRARADVCLARLGPARGEHAARPRCRSGGAGMRSARA